MTLFARVSVAEQLTAVVPDGNNEPEAGTHVTGRTPSTRSTAEVSYVTTAPLGPVGEVVMPCGNVNTGAVVSRMVTVKLSEATFAAESEAEQVTAIAPSGKRLPGAGTQLTGTGPSTSSVAEA
jgi:hypothetical protein